MKIALIGEYSGFHEGLKSGLEYLGHKVDIYSSGDSFKNISRDYNLSPKDSSIISRAEYYLFTLPKYIDFIAREYDIIQIVNPSVLAGPRHNFLYFTSLLKKLRKSNAILALAVAGCDTNTQRGLSSMKRSPCPGCLIESNLGKCNWTKERFNLETNALVELVDVIVPFSGFSYNDSYKDNLKKTPLLPLPIRTEIVNERTNSIGPNGKIKILHGISRAGFKGSDVIINALRNLELDCNNKFEILITENLKFKDYLKQLSNVNVVIDQLYGDSLGMNTLFSMLSSSIVFTSFDRKKVDNVDLVNAPVFQLADNVSDIVSQLKQLLNYSELDFNILGKNSRSFVLNNNNPVEIAKILLNYWRFVV